jgi:PAS domain S-box-containing protein
MSEDWKKYREKIIGLGESSSRKSYYPELQDKIAELETSRENLLTIINSINDALFIHDQSGKILLVNKKACEIYQFSEEDSDQYTIRDITSKQMDYEQLYPIWNDALNGKTHIFEWTSVNVKTKEEFPVQVSVNMTIWNGNKVLVAVVRDFRERKKYEEDLIAARLKAEENDRLKSAFLANISHEIRTPMNGILGFTELLKLPELTDEQILHYVHIIETCGARMLNIINDIMDISKVESGLMTISLNDINVTEILDYLFELFNHESNKKGLKLIKTEPISDNSMIINTDKDKLTAILTNLLKNAIKFSHKGTINFGYSIQEQDIEFFVKDTGIGISKEKIAAIFERFIRGDHEMSAEYEGAGLGLSIAKAYINMLGGKIWVESEKGIGSEFYFTLPLPPDYSNLKDRK